MSEITLSQSEDDEPLTEEQAEERKAAEFRLMLRDQELRDAAAYVVADERGRHFLWELLTYCGVYRTTFRSDAGLMAFEEGRRSTGLFVLDKALDVDGNVESILRNEEAAREVRYSVPKE